MNPIEQLRTAYLEAAALIENSDSDLEESLSEKDEEAIRELMRLEVSKHLREQARHL